MKRVVCLGTLTLAAVFTMVAAYEARQAHATLTVHEVADNLYMLANDPGGQLVLGAQPIQRLRGGTRQAAGYGAVRL